MPDPTGTLNSRCEDESCCGKELDKVFFENPASLEQATEWQCPNCGCYWQPDRTQIVGWCHWHPYAPFRILRRA